ncbi:protein smg8-like isoform X2 [Anneissia japonica]|uniref:protein smg8-like isoform X1 n=1 Tax=Anneissia japonica TaxID=1529436 RepID=UPI001425B4F2|nr:protein smg8-like isoform X1 [Anneissia japonica]XP_033100286.1 protein smg8-like isoform X2 [Anneissia japonica]
MLEPSQFPMQSDLKKLVGADDSVCVIGVIGKGSHGYRSKSLVINGILSQPVFKTKNLRNLEDSSQEECHIEYYYDNKENIVYLHLVSVFDVHHLHHLAANIENQLSSNEWHQFLKGNEAYFARALIFLFVTCHLIVVVHPTSVFDISYVQMFRQVEAARTKLIPHLSGVLKDEGVARDWQTTGRMCTPRLLFICQKSGLSKEEVTDTPDSKQVGRSRQKRKSPIQKLEHSLEDQIYKILRKSRVLTNNISHCLFTIPANQAFVYILRDAQQLQDPVHLLISNLSENLTNTRTVTNKLRSQNEMRRSRSSTWSSVDGPSTPAGEGEDESMKAFLMQHVKLVLQKKGFDDGLVRGAVPSHLEVPTLQKWHEISQKVHALFFGENVDSKLQSHFINLKASLDLEMRFSDARCAKIVPVASRLYQENASPFYISTVHRNKLSQAMKVFSQQARGPAVEKYAHLLLEECELFWQNGRQLCEVASLTGHHCILKLHLLPSDVVDTELEGRLPKMPHTNNNRTPCACNCGRFVSFRDDPFDLKIANYDYFEELAEKCCGKLKKISFSVYVPQRSSSSVEPEVPKTSPDDKRSSVLESIDHSKLDNVTNNAVCSPALSLGQSGGSDVFTHYNSSLSVNEAVITERGKLVKQLSMAEHLKGMTCTTSPAHLLPRFSSWSLLCLGKASLYNPAKGLEQPGFLRDSNYLLPWDIPVPKGSHLDPSWPAPGETGGRRGGRQRDKRPHRESSGENVIRAYIGNEFECPRGHRFICSSPDKIVKATNAVLKETATKLVHLDMPIYFPCSCRTTKPPLGQLLRTFIVTPDVPLYIKINPRVRPGSSYTPTFYPEGCADGVTLTRNAFWVLRYPYVYVSEAGPVPPPKDNTPPPGSKQLKGLFQTTTKAPE